MKRTILLAATALLGLSRLAGANQLSLDYHDYEPAAPNTAMLSITGDANVLSITQTAPASADQAASGNSLSITIEGNRNGGFDDAAFAPPLADFSLQPGLFSQEGLGNGIDFTVTGSSNLFAFAQTGNGNIAMGKMTGSGNQAVVQQMGNNNIAAFSQSGNGNIVSISQTAW